VFMVQGCPLQGYGSHLTYLAQSKVRGSKGARVKSQVFLLDQRNAQ
jgi:hypothetical protein